ncbi:hypothetical protein [Paenibacillus xylanexedens]|uniref:hypothetical protein n=1 Tax=Paenibacillus xylanexedens TaxID=528191 RepID=UPI0011A9AF91|nr:hypothetical protein [Paenibacillus xylanexedens]
MKVYYCEKLPNSLEFSCVVVAENEKDAKKVVKETAKSEGWSVDEEDLELIKLDTKSANAVILNPLQ